MAAFLSAIRAALPLPPDGGAAATKEVGNVTAPTLFICGIFDPVLLCSRPYSLKTSNYVTGAYTYMAVNCSHDLMNVGGQLGCNSAADVRLVQSAITAHISSFTSSTTTAVKQTNLASLAAQICCNWSVVLIMFLAVAVQAGAAFAL